MTRRSRLIAAPGIALLLVSLSALPASEDEFEAWKRASEQGVESVRQEFRQAIAEQDRQFSDYLRTQWAEFQAFPGRLRDARPKPRALPVAPGVPERPPAGTPPRPASPGADPGRRKPPAPGAVRPAPPAPVASVPPPPESVPPPGRERPVAPPAPPGPDAARRETPPPASVRPPAPPVASVPPPAAVVAPPAPERQAAGDASAAPARPAPPAPPAPKPAVAGGLAVDFYGTPLSLPFDASWKTLAPSALAPEAFARYWESMSATRFQPTLEAVAAARQSMGLDDWGHALLWQEIARSLQPGSPRGQVSLLWFFLVKSGFDTRPGYTDSQLLLLVAMRQQVYGTGFVKVGETAYYELFGEDTGKAARYATYSGKYPGVLRPLDVKVAATGFAAGGAAQRTLAFDSRGKRHKLEVVYQRPLTRYLDRFPQLDFELYLSTPPSPVTARSLAEALRPLLKGLSPEESVDLLLAFVQKAFEYKTDQEQFGREKYFFVEEVLHFPFSDCEDRSALFAWLVRDLLGLETVGLHYPGHMTTAVAMPSTRPDWQTVQWSGKRFVIADPTYVNASVGMAMPSYRGTQPLRVVALR